MLTNSERLALILQDWPVGERRDLYQVPQDAIARPSRRGGLLVTKAGAAALNQLLTMGIIERCGAIGPRGALYRRIK